MSDKEQEDPQEQVLLIANRLESIYDDMLDGDFLDVDEIMSLAKHLKKAVREMRKNTRNSIITQRINIE